MNANNDYRVCIKRQTIFYLIFRCTIQVVHITQLCTENSINTSKNKLQNDKSKIKYLKGASRRRIIIPGEGFLTHSRGRVNDKEATKDVAVFIRKNGGQCPPYL